MLEEQGGEVYEANDAGKLVGEVFSGQLTTREALQRLRTRLLDLSPRNRLLNYRHPRGKCVQFVGHPNLNLLFDRLLVDAKNIMVKPVPEPDPDTYDVRRPDPRQHAQDCGIDVSFEFPPSPTGDANNGKKQKGLQTLLYPAELRKLLKKIAYESKTAVEETGTNILFLVFGFLEFYDSDDSDRMMLAPLLALPASLSEMGVDEETSVVQYALAHSGEDLAENHTLREKLRQDFALTLPDFAEEDEPETYFKKVEKTIKARNRWRVRRQLTLGMLSFGKLALWEDLDPTKNPGLLEHPLLKSVFEGGTGEGGSEFYAEDYKIDEREDAELPIIYDADSSQHSAIIDAIGGKNMVINGPPGTGKSQTITNIIASNLSMGKTVLFVSEKLAALEVVRHRLNHAGLGHFCLELHSHKTQKKKFVEELQSRLDETFLSPTQLKAKLPTLQRQKSELARYAEIMGSRVGNALGLTVNEVFWAAERRRQELGDLASVAHAATLQGAGKWEADEIKERRDKVEALADLYRAIGSFDFSHPWWGFRPGQLGPGDVDAIADIIAAALEHARALDGVSEEMRAFLGDERQIDAKGLVETRERLKGLPDAPDNLVASLLEKMFGSEDPKGERSGKLLASVSSVVLHARGLLSSANSVLLDEASLSPETAKQARDEAAGVLTSAFMKTNLNEAEGLRNGFADALARFDLAVSNAKAPYAQIGKATLTGLVQRMEKTAQLEVFSVSARDILAKAGEVGSVARSLSADLTRVEGIAKIRHLPFDGSPASVSRLADPSSLDGLRPDAVVNQEVTAKGKALAERFPLSQRSLEDIAARGQRMRTLASGLSAAWERCQKTTRGLGLPFDESAEAVEALAALAKAAEAAPKELLDYRHSGLEHPRVAELAGKAEEVIGWEKAFRGELDVEFYLDALPTPEEMRASVRVFRRGDSLFNIFNSEWRASRRLFEGIAKTKAKRRAADFTDGLSRLLTWIERSDGFGRDEAFRESMGPLFKGLDTDVSKVRRLHAWYAESLTVMARVPGLMDKVNLSTIETGKIAQLAAVAAEIKADAEALGRAEESVREAMGADISGFREQREQGWPHAIAHLEKAVAAISECYEFFAARAVPSLSPVRAQELMEARLDLIESSGELARLGLGREALTAACGETLSALAPGEVAAWGPELERVNDACVRATVLADFLKDFFEMSVTPTAAKEFIEAKTSLDTAWAKCAILPSWDSVVDWNAWIARGKSAADAAGALLSVAGPCAKPGRSADDVFQAVEDRARGESMLNELQERPDVSKLLGEMFAGAETDLEALASTRSWGARFAEADMPASLRRRILSGSAVESLAVARRLFEEAGERGEKLVAALSGMEGFGSFNWDEWQKQARSDPKRDIPSEMRARLERASASIGEVLSWSKYLAARQERKGEGLGSFITWLESKTLPADSLGAAFELVTYQTIGKSIHQKFPELAKFNGMSHEKLQRDYQMLDKEIIRLTGRAFASQIDKRKSPPEGVRTAKVSDKTEMELVRHLITRPRARLSIRHILRKAGIALRELKPCFMMSPLSVATYIPQGSVQFDLLVMDEASQIRPEDALGGFARAKQVIVVGDPKQLPPSSFFDRLTSVGDDDMDDGAAMITDESESILDVCQDIFHPIRSLRWHYRSQHESLIAFSNHHFYKNLIVFPSPYAKSSRLGVRYRFVKGGVYKDRQNIPEAQRVVDAVLEHMLTRGEESLGVVTLNQTQRELIEELLDKKLREFEEGREYMSRWEGDGWPFFIKNLENVQGDERDVIFISTTFGKAPGSDKVRQNFGPISRPDGWRRLNVLFTRARRKVELFTSMSPEDVVADEKTPLGTKALKEYLDFAKRGILVSTDEGDRDPDSDFEVAVANVLRDHGYEVKPQLGVAGFFLDMAVRNPDRRGEFLAGIECDGAAYHSGFSVRDRDRIRQEILESLGWRGRIYRIWSTDWFYEPRRQIEKLLAFLEERRRLSSLEPDHEPEAEEFEEDLLAEEEEAGAVAMLEAETVASEIPVTDDAGDLFVEVGDRVVYFFADTPAEKHSVLIVDSASNPKMGIINEGTPLAQALLGSSTGETTSLSVEGHPPRHIHIFKIQRQEDLV